ncbi:hypothetical protein E3N88_44552 [Mikania micrantha]|uniref:Guanosine nucleotide diphosphate dissociation inhibitor n=1 Tax=Mikania micrantha TaxID=192012 RepID=A0A5N6LBQ1_9ASTR|nr:hypothetical protein E3N88_44552 [Mikania micrantha]
MPIHLSNNFFHSCQPFPLELKTLQILEIEEEINRPELFTFIYEIICLQSHLKSSFFQASSNNQVNDEEEKAYANETTTEVKQENNEEDAPFTKRKERRHQMLGYIFVHQPIRLELQTLQIWRLRRRLIDQNSSHSYMRLFVYNHISNLHSSRLQATIKLMMKKRKHMLMKQLPKTRNNEEDAPFTKRKRKKTSNAWIHFCTVINDDGSEVPQCMHCVEFKEVFENYADRESTYKTLPSNDDWKKVEDVCSFLSLFNEATKIISGSEYPTSNLFISELYVIKEALDAVALDEKDCMYSMACGVSFVDENESNISYSKASSSFITSRFGKGLKTGNAKYNQHIDTLLIRSDMDEEYDVVVLGTGLKECILSGLLSVNGLKVLHMDRNDYYGGESTSLNLIQLWKKFRGSDKPPSHLGSSRDYNVDMIPKFIMANGALVRVLIHTDVTKYLYFKAVDGSFVYNKGKVHKVPATDMEALKSPLMGIFEKRRARKFFIYVQDYVENDPKTHEGLDLTRVTTRELIAKYGLDDNTVDFIGHALALHRDDRYLNEPALDTVKRMKLYAESLARFQGGSPYIYPLYGLGELPQAFARLSAVYGGTYMLNKPECKVEFDEEGKVCGVTSEGETAKCKKVVCDPSYLPNKVRKVGKVARAICIMSHPIPNTNDSHSVQVILPQKQLGRKSDMYLFCCSYSHNVAPKGKFIAFVSTEAESDQPEVELKPGLDLLGPVDEIFYDVYDRYEPVNEPSLDNCFISTSYDATTHFESTVIDVLNMYSMITGKVLDLNVDLSAASAAEE